MKSSCSLTWWNSVTIPHRTHCFIDQLQPPSADYFTAGSKCQRVQRHPGSDQLCWPVATSQAALLNSGGARWLKARIKIPRPGQKSHPITGDRISFDRINNSNNSLIITSGQSRCFSAEGVTQKRISENYWIMFLPLSHSNVPAVETLCQGHRRAPCNRSRSPPLLRSQRSGRWAPRHSLSPPKSPTRSQRLRGSYCLQTGHGRTGPWFWLPPLVDLHTLNRKVELSIFAEKKKWADGNQGQLCFCV